MRRGQRGDPAQEALGRSQGGFSTKVHLKAEGSGQPLTVVLTPGQQHEATVAPRLLRQGAVRRRGPGRPRGRPRRAVGDKGYSSRARRADCRRRGSRHPIPRRRTEQRSGPVDRAGYRRGGGGAAGTRSPGAAPSNGAGRLTGRGTGGGNGWSDCSTAASSIAASPPATRSAARATAPGGRLR